MSSIIVTAYSCTANGAKMENLPQDSIKIAYWYALFYTVFLVLVFPLITYKLKSLVLLQINSKTVFQIKLVFYLKNLDSLKDIP